MRWQGREQSKNIDDRRGRKTMTRVGGGIGIGTILVILINLMLGGDISSLIGPILSNATNQSQVSNDTPYQGSEQEEALRDIVGVVLNETEKVWEKIFREQLNRSYQPTTLVLFTDSNRSACGYAQAATGPFFGPVDQKVYICLNFYNGLSRRFGASGDFAMAYVVAHEVAHHVQNLLGISRQVDAQRGRVSETQMNDLSVRLELQADFLSGVWAHHAHKMSNILEKGDIEEAMRAAEAIGDDNIQKKSQGYVVPESFTHGTSEQRMRWLRKGIETGDINQGDTFNTRNL